MSSHSLNYPAELQYDPSDKRYTASPELEAKNREWADQADFSFDRGRVELPLATFGAAFEFAYQALGEYYTFELIDDQLPFYINYKDGVWIAMGALPKSPKLGSVALGGNAEIAFKRDTGEILYIYHSL